MKRFIKTNWKWFLVGLVLIIIYLMWGGITITIRNQSAYDICEVYYASEPIEQEGGKKKLLFGYIHARQSRDIHLPVFFTWFKDGQADQLFVRSVGCGGEIMDYWQIDTSSGNYFMREIR